MTGEMSWADLKDYPDMLEMVRRIRKEAKVAAQLRPFDVYQGPYIAVNLTGSPNTRKLASWNLEVWYEGKYPELFVVHTLPSYLRKFTKPMWADQVVDFIWKKKPKRKVAKKAGGKKR